MKSINIDVYNSKDDIKHRTLRICTNCGCRLTSPQGDFNGPFYCMKEKEKTGGFYYCEDCKGVYMERNSICRWDKR